MNIKTVFTIHEIKPEAWDALSGEQPFQSHRWYAFGERVMGDCLPVYLLVYENDQLLARACLWLVRNEPLPSYLPGFLKALISVLIRRWPLLICRSPLANAAGIILPDDGRRGPILALLGEAARGLGRKLGASIILFDFLSKSEVKDWPANFVTSKLPSPGTVLENRWQTLEHFLADQGKKGRQHYKKSLREAQNLGIELTPRKTVTDVNAALKLIRKVESRYGSPPSPWTRNLLQNLEFVDGTWFEAHIGERLVGCGLAVEDNRAQMTTALGLEENIPYAYFLLIYASLEHAFQRNVRLLRWGTGAYEVKERLGFRLEPDNFLTLCGTNRLTSLIGRIAAN